MTLNSDIHDNKCFKKDGARRQARMVAGIAAFRIIHVVEKRKKRKSSWCVWPWAREERRLAECMPRFHAHEQTVTCDKFYLSQKLVRQLFSKRICHKIRVNFLMYTGK